MAGWHLNPFLTSFREAVNEAYPRRGKASDGTLGDLAHAARSSEHNPDTDGSVDAWDMDVNLLGSSTPTGTAAELAEVRAVLARFQKQPGAQLWIFRGKIANRDVDNWRVREYDGPNPHDHHAHLQSKQTREKQRFTGVILPASNKEPDMAIDSADATLISRNLLGTKVGDSGPTVGVILQSGYANTIKLVAAITAEAQRDATQNAILAGMQTALSAIASSNGALTDAQVAALTAQVGQAAAAAGAEAVSALKEGLDSLRAHLGDEAA